MACTERGAYKKREWVMIILANDTYRETGAYRKREWVMIILALCLLDNFGYFSNKNIIQNNLLTKRTLA